MTKRFATRSRGTTLQREIVAGLTTFMTMSYIVFVNPQILAHAGVPAGPAIAATALVACITTLIMGLMTNLPLAMASGMGINAAVTYGMVRGAGMSWHQ